ncbi:MAG: EAL domain-containing protein [Atopobiaceae bacterium]|nr:EAL domain-containing protein [Atopobiaceae bacterium]
MIQSKQIRKSQLVLVVDDMEINRDVLGIILEDQYEVIFAADGEEALQKIYQYQHCLSVVLLDLIMPKMNGFEVLEHIRNDDSLQYLPVIVLTAEKSAELRALQMGAADFITKPFDVHEVILARVARIIELSEGRQLISAAEHDKLTMLYTRNFFFEYANRIQHFQQARMDAVVLNIEQFHSVNALNGYEFGDEVLRTLGDEIRAFLQETDGIASRFEADRFDIYCAHQGDYQAMLNRFQNALNKLSHKSSIRLRMGVCLWAEGVDPVLMFDQANAACSKVRGDYMRHLMVYDEQLREHELLDQRLLNDLQRAVDERQLQVYYQPKYDVTGERPRLSSAEALIRWNHPELGMIPPGTFIPLFESNGQIGVIDKFVWNEAARQLSEWHARYDIDLSVSVNLSRVDLFDPVLESTLSSLVESNGLEHMNLKLEVTESAYTENSDYVIETVNRLRDMGFEIEMDDFGSGYSSLNMLSAMPIDVLKMDMKFIRNIEHSEKDLRLAELVLDIARYLKVPVVAEGVETEGQLQLLRDAGCDIIQGYFFSPPLPADKFEELIKRELNRA